MRLALNATFSYTCKFYPLIGWFYGMSTLVGLFVKKITKKNSILNTKNLYTITLFQVTIFI